MIFVQSIKNQESLFHCLHTTSVQLDFVRSKHKLVHKEERSAILKCGTILSWICFGILLLVASSEDTFIKIYIYLRINIVNINHIGCQATRNVDNLQNFVEPSVYKFRLLILIHRSISPGANPQVALEISTRLLFTK